MTIARTVRIITSALLLAVSFTAVAQHGDARSSSEPASVTSNKKVDRALQKSIRRALSKAQNLNATNILVRARSGVVTLQGTVPETAQIGLAANATQTVPGVTSVINQLRVGTSP